MQAPVRGYLSLIADIISTSFLKKMLIFGQDFCQQINYY